ncbi:MAG TPA: magnesium transporter, partial [Rhodospirillales bacterium]|nr:magnesium transporter [Rhodospirillales bacterium]
MTGTAFEEREQSQLVVTDALVSEVRQALEEGNLDLAAALTRPLHAADLADLIQLLEPEERLRLVAALGPDMDPDTFSY